MKIFCVIPAYNEAKNIAEVVNSIKTLVDTVVVIDDGSQDKTYDKIINEQGVIALRHLINRGQGAALKTGTIYSLEHGADIIVHFDADGQFQVEDVKNALEIIKIGSVDIIFGSRFLTANNQMPFSKKYIIYPLAKLFNYLVGIRLTDPQSGFRVMTSEVAKKIIWQQDRMAHCSEIIFLAHKNKLKIKEIPITVIYHRYGQKMSGGFKILRDLLVGKLTS